MPVAIALGSNLGDRDSQLDEAEDRLAALLSGAVASARYETASVGGPAGAPDYLNEVVVGTTLAYGRFLEEGTAKMEPRPYLKPTLTQMLPTIRAIIGRPLK